MCFSVASAPKHTGGAPCAVRCAKSQLFFTNGSHGSQGPEFCTPDAVLNGSCMLLQVGGFQGSGEKQKTPPQMSARTICF